jgi:hypothetical protein
MTRTFVTSKISSTHGTRKAAEAQASIRTVNPDVTYTVEHTGPRLFVVICTVTVESEPRPVRHIMGGQQIVCECGSEDWYYTGRSLFNLNYECASCDRKISPVSETGACQ